MNTNQPQPIRVLLADDHSIVRAGFRQIFETAGDIAILSEAADGEEACRQIELLRPDVAVLDIHMPAKTGIEVVRWVRARGLTTGLLILTAYDEDPYVRAVLQAGANGYVLKTADPLEIMNAVREVNAGRIVLDSAIASRVEMVDHAPDLTARELEILSLAAQGLTNKAIAVQLSISDRTVQNHLAHIFEKLNAASRTEAVMRAVSLGWIPAHPRAEPD